MFTCNYVESIRSHWTWSFCIDMVLMSKTIWFQPFYLYLSNLKTNTNTTQHRTPIPQNFLMSQNMGCQSQHAPQHFHQLLTTQQWQVYLKLVECTYQLKTPFASRQRDTFQTFRLMQRNEILHNCLWNSQYRKCCLLMPDYYVYHPPQRQQGDIAVQSVCSQSHQTSYVRKQ